MATFGEKLQRLIDAGCITKTAARQLKPEQLQAIEDLTKPQVNSLIAVQESVGKVKGSMI